MPLSLPGSITVIHPVGQPDKSLQKLQYVQNIGAWVLTKTKKIQHITSVLDSLHWLPMKYRIEFKMLLLVFKMLHGTSPTDLQSLLGHYTPARTLRSSTAGLLSVEDEAATMGDRAFC